MQFKVDKNVLQEVLNYLSTKPFSEVQNLIRAIQDNARAVQEKAAAGSQEDSPKAEQPKEESK